MHSRGSSSIISTSVCSIGTKNGMYSSLKSVRSITSCPSPRKSARSDTTTSSCVFDSSSLIDTINRVRSNGRADNGTWISSFLPSPSQLGNAVRNSSATDSCKTGSNNIFQPPFSCVPNTRGSQNVLSVFVAEPDDFILSYDLIRQERCNRRQVFAAAHIIISPGNVLVEGPRLAINGNVLRVRIPRSRLRQIPNLFDELR